MTNMRRFINTVAFGCLLASLLAGCGNSSSTQAVPTTATIFYSHSLAFQNLTGTAMSWGYNGFGQLGDGTVVTRSTPVKIVGLSGMKGLSVGADHSVAFANNSTVRAWGYNGFGQLGVGTAASPVSSTTYSAIPVKVGTMSGITAVAAGGHHSLALQGNTGTVWSWGYNADGELGNGTNVNTNMAATAVPQVPPSQVLTGVGGAPLANITKIAAGGLHSLALQENFDSSGTLLSQALYAWGDNADGQLGQDPVAVRRSSLPVPVILPDTPPTNPIIAIAAGGSFSLALTRDGRVWAWGYNGFGQLGIAPVTVSRFTPAAIQVLDTNGTPVVIKEIAAGLDHVLALDASGQLWAWGFNVFGQLGNNTVFDSFKPVSVVNSATGPIQSIVRVVGHHNLVQDSTGHLWAWGDNGLGQVGDGTTSNRSVPVRVSGF